jgi:hypothetical protein
VIFRNKGIGMASKYRRGIYRGLAVGEMTKINIETHIFSSALRALRGKAGAMAGGVGK